MLVTFLDCINLHIISAYTFYLKKKEIKQQTSLEILLERPAFCTFEFEEIDRTIFLNNSKLSRHYFLKNLSL
jgi:hypothetical protein